MLCGILPPFTRHRLVPYPVPPAADTTRQRHSRHGYNTDMTRFRVLLVEVQQCWRMRHFSPPASDLFSYFLCLAGDYLVVLPISSYSGLFFPLPFLTRDSMTIGGYTKLFQAFHSRTMTLMLPSGCL